MKVFFRGLPKAGGTLRYYEDLKRALPCQYVYPSDEIDRGEPIHAIQPVAFGKMSVVTIHSMTPYFEREPRYNAEPFTTLYKMQLKHSVKEAKHIVVSSKMLAAQVEKVFGHADKIRVVNFGIDPDRL